MRARVSEGYYRKTIIAPPFRADFAGPYPPRRGLSVPIDVGAALLLTLARAPDEAAAISLRSLHALPAGKRADDLAGLVEDQLAPIGLDSKDEQERPAVLAQALVAEVVAEWGRAAVPVAALDARGLPPDRHLGKVLGLLARLPLLDGPEQIVGRVAGEVLADVQHLDAVGAEDVPVVPGLVDVEPAEALDVVDDDVRERPALRLGQADHLLEGRTPDGARPADGVVDEVPGQLEVVLGGVALDGLPLVGDGLLLAVGRAAEVANGYMRAGPAVEPVGA